MTTSELNKRPTFPKMFPLLTADDFCRHEWHQDSNGLSCETREEIKMCCLEGWALLVFENRAEFEISLETLNEFRDRPYYRKLVQAIQDIVPKKRLPNVGKSELVMETNDDKRRRTSTLARIWARFGALLGYVVNNPEADKK